MCMATVVELARKHADFTQEKTEINEEINEEVLNEEINEMKGKDAGKGIVLHEMSQYEMGQYEMGQDNSGKNPGKLLELRATDAETRAKFLQDVVDYEDRMVDQETPPLKRKTSLRFSPGHEILRRKWVEKAAQYSKIENELTSLILSSEFKSETDLRRP
jgi:hypothetical protein